VTVHLHVERLVLDGVGARSSDAARIATTLRAELTRSLSARPLATAAGGALDSAPASAILLGDGRPDTVGRWVAASVDGAVRTASGDGR
jgi:hypothetical protein